MLKIRNLEQNLGGFCIEAEFYYAIKKAEADNNVISRFSVEPKFSGIAGHFGGKDYDSGIEKTKYKIRSFSRIAAPWLHF